MKNYLVKVTAQIPCPRSREYREGGGQIIVAIRKALKKYRQDFKGKRIKEVDIHLEQLD